MKKINRKKENCKCKYESRLTNIFTTTNNGKVIQHFVNSELRCEFKKEDMTREEFISKIFLSTSKYSVIVRSSVISQITIRLALKVSNL